MVRHRSRRNRRKKTRLKNWFESREWIINELYSNYVSLCLYARRCSKKFKQSLYACGMVVTNFPLTPSHIKPHSGYRIVKFEITGSGGLDNRLYVIYLLARMWIMCGGKFGRWVERNKALREPAYPSEWMKQCEWGECYGMPRAVLTAHSWQL